MEQLTRTLNDGVLTLTLNRPEALNALTRALLAALRESLAEAARDDAVRAVVLTGEGRGFCTGQDLSDIEPNASLSEMVAASYNPVVRTLAALDKPVIAAVNGAAAGAGLSLALACDLRIAADNASFVTAFTRIGLVMDSGMSYFLPRLVGWPKAFELLAFSPRLSAQEALACGLVDKVVPLEQVRQEAQALAAQLAQGPTRAYRLIKQALRRSATADLDEMLNLEALFQGLAGNTSDYREGVQAFLEKRQPRFTGQ